MQGVKVLALVAGLFGLSRVLSGQVAAGEGGQLSIEQVRKLADDAARIVPDVDPLMLRTMVEIESSRQPGAFRPEPHLIAPDGSQGDASIGLMQTLWGTAHWLASSIGFTKFGVPSMADLLIPERSMYFGAAFINWLKRWHRQRFGSEASEEWIVMSYNGGPNANNPATRNHFRKYVQAKARLLGGENVT